MSEINEGQEWQRQWKHKNARYKRSTRMSATSEGQEDQRQGKYKIFSLDQL